MDESVREMVQVIVDRLKAFVDGDEDAPELAVCSTPAGLTRTWSADSK
jgi:hypothetical protein